MIKLCHKMVRYAVLGRIRRIKSLLPGHLQQLTTFVPVYAVMLALKFNRISTLSSRSCSDIQCWT
jgi:hypothetical protein